MIIWNEEHTEQLNFEDLDLENGTVYQDSNGDFVYHIYTEEEKRNIKRNIRENHLLTEIGNRQVELQQTDYVVIKIYEAVIENEDTESLKTLYADVLARRKVLRQEINQLQEELKMLK